MIFSPGLRVPNIQTSVSCLSMPNFAYYAVLRGEEVGIYRCWEDCKAQVHGFKNALFRKFFCHPDAKRFLEKNGLSTYYDCGVVWPFHEHRHEYYAVARGFMRGIYCSIQSAREQLLNYKRNEFRMFSCYEDAERYLRHRGVFKFFVELGTEIPNPSTVFKMQKTFHFDKYGFVIVHIDGFCIDPHLQAQCKAGVGIWWKDNHRLNVSRPVYGEKSSVKIAEAQAYIETLEIAEREHMPGIRIYMESYYIYSFVLNNLERWHAAGYRNAKGQPLGNPELLARIYELRQKVFHEVELVQPNERNPGDEAARELSMRGAERFGK